MSLVDSGGAEGIFWGQFQLELGLKPVEVIVEFESRSASMVCWLAHPASIESNLFDPRGLSKGCILIKRRGRTNNLTPVKG